MFCLQLPITIHQESLDSFIHDRGIRLRIGPRATVSPGNLLICCVSLLTCRGLARWARRTWGSGARRTWGSWARALLFHALVTCRAVRNVLVAAFVAHIAGLAGGTLIFLGALFFHTLVTRCAVWNILAATFVAHIAGLAGLALVTP